MDNKKISVLIIISRTEKCGPNMILLPVVKEMRAQRFDVHMLILFREKADNVLHGFDQVGAEIKRADISSNKRVGAIRREIKRCLRQWDPDIVYSSGLSANYHTARVIRDRPLYCTLHNNAYVDLRYGFNRIMAALGVYMTDYAVRHTEYVICCSQAIRKIYQKRFPRKKIFCIQNGTDTTRFQCWDRTAEEKKDSIVFLVSGSLDNRKDPLTIIKAFQRAGIADRVTLIFAGTGELLQQCEELAGEGSIIFLGFVDNIEKYYQMADVYVSASYSEGLPNSVLEAASCGCRMILSDIPQHREIFKEQDDCVSFFETGNVEQLSGLFQQNIKCTGYQERKKISRYIDENFSSDVMAKKYCKFMREHSSGV